MEWSAKRVLKFLARHRHKIGGDLYLLDAYFHLSFFSNILLKVLINALII